MYIKTYHVSIHSINNNIFSDVVLTSIQPVIHEPRLTNLFLFEYFVKMSVQNNGCFEICFSCLNQLLKIQINNSHDIPRSPPDDHKINCGWFITYAIFYIITIFIGFKFSWQNIIFFPSTFITTLIVLKIYKYCLNHNYIISDKVHFSDLFRAFSHSFFGCAIFALVFGGIFETLLLLTLFYSKVIDIDLKTISEGNFYEYRHYKIIHVYLFINAFFVASLIEECVKGFILQYVSKLYLSNKIYLGRNDIKTFVWLGICVGLGFGTMEGIIYTCVYGYKMSFFDQFQVFLIRIFIAIPFHTLLGFLWGINLGERDCLKNDLTWFKIGYFQVCFFMHDEIFYLVFFRL